MKSGARHPRLGLQGVETRPWTRSDDAQTIWCCSLLPKQPSWRCPPFQMQNTVRMNTRRDLLLMLGVGALLTPRTALAQQRGPATPRQIGFLTRKKDASVLTQIQAFRQELQGLGWLEGGNINIEYRDADGKLNRLDALALELVNLNVDVIVTVDTPPTQAAKRATSTIPIVVAVSADPVGAGLVESLAHPGGNTTGLSLLAPGTDQKNSGTFKRDYSRGETCIHDR